MQPFGFSLSPESEQDGEFGIMYLIFGVVFGILDCAFGCFHGIWDEVCCLPTMEESVIDSDVFVVDGTVEGEGDHHGEVGDLSKAL